MGMPFDQMIPLLGIYLKKPKTLIEEYISTLIYVHWIVIYNHQHMVAAQVSISRWVDKITIGCLHDGIVLSHKKEENFTLCDSMGEPGEHYAKWNKPVRERQMPYDFTYVWNLINKIN